MASLLQYNLELQFCHKRSQPRNDPQIIYSEWNPTPKWSPIFFTLAPKRSQSNFGIGFERQHEKSFNQNALYDSLLHLTCFHEFDWTLVEKLFTWYNIKIRWFDVFFQVKLYESIDGQNWNNHNNTFVVLKMAIQKKKKEKWTRKFWSWTPMIKFCCHMCKMC